MLSWKGGFYTDSKLTCCNKKKGKDFRGRTRAQAFSEENKEAERRIAEEGVVWRQIIVSVFRKGKREGLTVSLILANLKNVSFLITFYLVL